MQRLRSRLQLLYAYDVRDVCQPVARSTQARPARASKEAGSIAVLTLIAMAALLAAFLYVGVIGNRVTTTVRVRTAADAAALAASTVKARTLNYESFVLMAQSVLYPLAQVAHYITSVQVANQDGTVCAAMLLVKGMETLGDACLAHVLETNTNSQTEDHNIQAFLSSLAQVGGNLDTVGPLWAESVAVQTATHPSYQSGSFPIDLVQIFPTPNGTASCSSLGITITSPASPHGVKARKACEALQAWELAYVAMSMDVTNAPIDAWAWELATTATACSGVPSGAKPLCNLLAAYPDLYKMKSPTQQTKQAFSVSDLQKFIKARDSYNASINAAIPANLPSSNDLSNPQKSSACATYNQIPDLADDWKTHTRSVAMTMQSRTSDRYFIAYLESMRRSKTAQTVPTGGPLGMACAEHYSVAAVGSEGLTSMDWRARLIPCAFATAANANLVLSCGGQTGPIGLQFQKELALGIQNDWRY